jgi:hypothetical protein
VGFARLADSFAQCAEGVDPKPGAFVLSGGGAMREEELFVLKLWGICAKKKP